MSKSGESQQEASNEPARELVQESVNESQETRRFDSEPIRVGLPRPGLVLRQRYRLDSELGRGAMGIVFRATDLELLRPVAVKVLAERLTKEEQEATTEGRRIGEPGKRGTGKGEAGDSRSRFMREARAAAALNHPHIVAIYDVGEDHGFPFFVMELVEGPNLGQTPPHDLQQVIEFACRSAPRSNTRTTTTSCTGIEARNVLLSEGLSALRLRTQDAGLRLRTQNSRLKSQASRTSSKLKAQSSDRKSQDSGLRTPDSDSKVRW